MHFFDVHDQAELESLAALAILEVLQHPDGHVVLATGSSPKGAYAEVADRIRQAGPPTSHVHVTMLDEWHGLPAGAESCRTYLRKNVVAPWGIDPTKFLAFDTEAADAVAECQRISEAMEQLPPVGLVVLGLGVNGHVGMNEPGEAHVPGIHVSQLAESSRSHSMLAGLAKPPTQGMTMGLDVICRAGHVLMLVSGPTKRGALHALMNDKIECQVPGSLLRLARSCDVLYTCID